MASAEEKQRFVAFLRQKEWKLRKHDSFGSWAHVVKGGRVHGWVRRFRNCARDIVHVYAAIAISLGFPIRSFHGGFGGALRFGFLALDV